MPALPSGAAHHERDPHAGVEQILAVIEVVVVLAQALAMVRGHHDDGVVLVPGLLKDRQDLPHLGIGERDLAVVLRHVPTEPRLAGYSPLLRDAPMKPVHHRQ